MRQGLTPNRFLLLGALLAACDQRPRAVDPPLACAAPDSMADSAAASRDAAPLRFSSAYLGMRGTSGGTFLGLSRDSAGWHALLRPVGSDFPGEDNAWPAAAESLAVEWLDPGLGLARARPGSRGLDTLNRPLLGDSLWLVVGCEASTLLRWRGRSIDETIPMERTRSYGGG